MIDGIINIGDEISIISYCGPYITQIYTQMISTSANMLKNVVTKEMVKMNNDMQHNTPLTMICRTTNRNNNHNLYFFLLVSHYYTRYYHTSRRLYYPRQSLVNFDRHLLYCCLLELLQ